MSPITTERAPAEDPALARITAATVAAAEKTVNDGEPIPMPVFGPPRNLDFGDLSTNIALQLAKRAKRPPKDIAEAIARELRGDASLREDIASADAAGGFINLRLSATHWQRKIRDILRDGADYGRGESTGRRISFEFGSANPTGPVVVVQGRTLSLGASLVAAMRYCGETVETEWIINDQGSQIDTLGRSTYARYRQIDDPSYPFPEEGYPGDYLIPIAEHVHDHDGTKWVDKPEHEWLPYFATFTRDTIVAGQQRTCDRFGAVFDRWQSERELHARGAVEAGIARLRELGTVYDAEGAVFMRNAEFGDTKDRVVVRSDGRPTYYGADVAYHYDKLERADRALLILGPDHHGYVARLQGIATAFGRPGAIEVLIAQQMTLMRDGHEVSMSKRAGNVLTLDEIIDEVGVDAARFFFVMLSADTPMTFDLSLAVEQSSNNPVYYVQYGHARIASIERKAPPHLLSRALAGEGLARLGEPAELALARRLSEFPSTVRSVAASLAPNRLARYAQDVAADFHQFYMHCVVLGPDEELSSGRLALAHAAKTILAATLAMLGVSAPEQMTRADDAPSRQTDG